MIGLARAKSIACILRGTRPACCSAGSARGRTERRARAGGVADATRIARLRVTHRQTGARDDTAVARTYARSAGDVAQGIGAALRLPGEARLAGLIAGRDAVARHAVIAVAWRAGALARLANVPVGTEGAIVTARTIGIGPSARVSRRVADLTGIVRVGRVGSDAVFVDEAAVAGVYRAAVRAAVAQR